MLDVRVEAWPREEGQGEIVLVATPIGNRQDITLRALSCLEAADVIACEDTRHSRPLLAYYGIEKPLVSYHAHNEQERSQELLARAQAGDLVAVISDAGMPGVSDPGAILLAKAWQAGVKATVLPGPSAGVTGQVAAGLGDGSYVFWGFLPRKGRDREERLAAMERKDGLAHVFYEAPHRIRSTLEEMGRRWADRDFVLLREWTKHFEERIAFRGSEVDQLSFPEKGELVVVVGPMPKTVSVWDDTAVVRRLQELEGQGWSGKEAIQQVAEESGRRKKEIYRLREENKA